MSAHDEATEDSLYAVVQTLNAVALALIETHADPAAVASLLRSHADHVEGMFLGTKMTDARIERVKTTMLAFAKMAEDTQSRRKSR